MNRKERRAAKAGIRAGAQFIGRASEGFSGLFDFAKDFAINGFAVGAGEFSPAAFIVDKDDGNRVTIAEPVFSSEAKFAMYDYLHDLFKEWGVIQYAHISECWTSESKTAEFPGPPSEDPNRREALVVAVMDRFGNAKIATAVIERDDKPALLPWNEEMTGHPGGRMFSLLDTETAH